MKCATRSGHHVGWPVTQTSEYERREEWREGGKSRLAVKPQVSEY